MADPHTPEWMLADSSTIYMDGTAVYYLRRYGKPGHVANIQVRPETAEEFRASLREMQADAWDAGWCQGWDDREAWNLDAANPYRPSTDSEDRQ